MYKIDLHDNILGTSVDGWGSQFNARRVARLPRLAKLLIAKGETVILMSCPPAHGTHGSTLRRVVESGGRYYTRMV